MVSCRYFMRGETACKSVTWTDSGEPAAPALKTQKETYVIVVDGVWRQADVLDVPPQLRQHLQRHVAFMLRRTNRGEGGGVEVAIEDLLSQHCDEVLGFPLQVQVHVVQLPVESLVDLLLPLQPAGLLHGPLHAGPVQVAGQVGQGDAHVLHAVQGDAELAESKEEKKRRDRGWRWRHREGKEAGLQRSGGMGGATVND